MERTRIAPSPSGEMHIGTLRTALLNFIHARANEGYFILRIDDTNKEKSTQANIDYIYKVLEDFGLLWDDSFKQSYRIDRYLEVAEKIGKEREKKSYYLNLESNGTTYEETIIKSSSEATYNFASILDDLDYGITTIIRGSDHLNNLPKQVQIFDRIKTFDTSLIFPNVLHAGLLLENGKKLSKSAGTGSVRDYESYSKPALLNWLFRLGWSHPDPNFDKKYPILTIKDMIELYNEGHINGKNMSVDKNKLNFLNKRHYE